MLKLISAALKSAPEDFWLQKIKSDFDINCHPKEPGTPLDPLLLRQTYYILKTIPIDLVKATEVKNLFFSNRLGPNLAFWPGHGYFEPANQSITLNNNIFYDPDVQDDFFDSTGRFLSRPQQTLSHELSHALDQAMGLPSQKEEWLKLSGWSKTPKPGLKRLIINDPEAPGPVIGTWWYSQSAEFSRFYGKKCPEDDWADNAAFIICGMKSKVPAEKRKYFDDLLGKYFNTPKIP